MNSPKRARRVLVFLLTLSLVLTAFFYARKQYAAQFEKQFIRLFREAGFESQYSRFKLKSFFTFQVDNLDLIDPVSKKKIFESKSLSGKLSQAFWLKGVYTLSELQAEECEIYFIKDANGNWNPRFNALIPSRKIPAAGFIRLPYQSGWSLQLFHLTLSNLALHYEVLSPAFKSEIKIPLLDWRDSEHSDLSAVRAVIILPFVNTPGKLEGIYSQSLRQLKFKLESLDSLTADMSLSLGSPLKLEGSLHLQGWEWPGTVRLPYWGSWQGRITGDFEFGLEGEEPGAWLKTLGLQGPLEVRNGVLLDRNAYLEAFPALLLKEYLQRPHLSDFDDLLRRKNTEFERFEAKVSLLNGFFQIENGFIKSDNAIADFFVSYNLHTHDVEWASKLILLEKWSAYLTVLNPAWNQYQNENKRLIFENTYRGVITN